MQIKHSDSTKIIALSMLKTAWHDLGTLCLVMSD